MSKYTWRLKSFAAGINPNEAVMELEKIENIYGSLTPENILKASEDRDSVLHKLFTWDNDVAAEKYRLQQARNLLNNIEITIVSEGQVKVISVYEVVKTNEGRVYKNIQDFTSDDVSQVKSMAVRELGYWKNKLSFYNRFTSATKKIDEAIHELGS